jgi:hypothetical protein
VKARPAFAGGSPRAIFGPIVWRREPTRTSERDARRSRLPRATKIGSVNPSGHAQGTLVNDDPGSSRPMSDSRLSDHSAPPLRGATSAPATVGLDGLPWWSRDTLKWVAEKRPFRLASAIVLVLLHLLVAIHFGKTYNLPFNAAPGASPYYSNPVTEGAPNLWDRLLVSRWDSVHYLALSLRGYSTCAPRPVPPNFLENLGQCQLSFFPGYPLLGWLASFGARLPIDWVMLGLSLIASVVFLYLWTHEVIRRALGTGGCYLSLLAFNVFPSAFALVTIQTEPLVLASTLGCFIALQTRRPTLGAVLSGLATGIRITGVGLPVAFALSLLAMLWSERPKITAGLVLATVGRLALSAWGIAVMMAYQQYRFHDALVYLHSHGRAFQHEPSLSSVFLPDADLIHRSITAFEHEGVWVGVALLWLALGFRKALDGFTFPAKAFWIGLTVATLGIAMPGSVGLAYAGMIRYLLLEIPLFFSIAVVVRRNAAALVLWVLLSSWNYYNFSLRFYLLHSPFVTHWSPHLQLPPRPEATPLPLPPVGPEGTPP